MHNDDFIPISALQHYMYCPRQCALIHIERVWTENAFTAEGRILHEKAHDVGSESRKDRKIVTGLQLCSNKWAVLGQADVVEFHKEGKAWLAYPIEYKRGRAKKNHMDRVQLCAQALCLEEMLNQQIIEGALYYGKTRRREKVLFTDELRDITVSTIKAVHSLVQAGITPPPPENAPQCCAACSLEDQCLPLLLTHRQKASQYLNKLVRDA